MLPHTVAGLGLVPLSAKTRVQCGAISLLRAGVQLSAPPPLAAGDVPRDPIATQPIEVTSAASAVRLGLPRALSLIFCLWIMSPSLRAVPMSTPRLPTGAGRPEACPETTYASTQGRAPYTYRADDARFARRESLEGTSRAARPGRCPGRRRSHPAGRGSPDRDRCRHAGGRGSSGPAGSRPALRP